VACIALLNRGIYMANDRLIVTDEFNGRVAIVAYLEYYDIIYLREQRTTTKVSLDR
jgi:hypothetical protein